MISSRLAVLIGLVLSLALSAAAFGESVLQTVSVRVGAGQMDTYLNKVEKLQGVMDRLGGGAKVQVWQATAAGTNSGSTLVGISYPSLDAYADVTTKAGSDAEWQQIVGNLDEIRTVVSTSLLASRDGAGVFEPTGEGAVLQGVIVRVGPGQLDAYLAQLESLRGVQKKLESSGEMRVWQATLAGEGTGNVIVGITYPSLKDYANDSGKLGDDEAGQKIFADLEKIRTVVSSSLFVSP